MDKDNIVYKELKKAKGQMIVGGDFHASMGHSTPTMPFYLEDKLFSALQKIKEHWELQRLNAGDVAEDNQCENYIEAYQEIIDALNFKE